MTVLIISNAILRVNTTIIYSEKIGTGMGSENNRETDEAQLVFFSLSESSTGYMYK